LRLIERHNLHPHAYADDTQINGFCPPSAISVLHEQMSACLDEVALWMRSNRLQLNTAKTVEDGSPLVRHESETVSDSTGFGAGRRGPHNPRHLCTGSGHLARLRHLEDCVELLCCSSTDPQHTLLCLQACRRTCRRFCHDSITAVPHSSVYRHTRSMGCSPC